MTSDRSNSLWRANGEENVIVRSVNKSGAYDLAIVGGGFTGTAAALEASSSGASVCLLEANEIGYGGSGRNVGLVNSGLWLTPEAMRKALGEAESKKLLSALSKAPDKVFGLIERYGIDCEATRNGTLHCAHSRGGLTNLEDRYRQAAEMGSAWRLLDADETRKRTGSETFYGALFDPRAGTIQPLSYCSGLARAAEQQGAEIFQKSPVSEIAYADNAWRIVSGDHEISAEALLVATNAYHQGFASPFKPAFVKVSYMQFATAPLPEKEREWILPGEEGCWDTALVLSSFRLDKAGRLILGGMGNLTGPGSRIHRGWARRKLLGIYPQLKGADFEYAWCGQIAMTSDHIPKIVKFGPKGYACFGYSGRGIGPSTVFGQAAARALMTNDPAYLPLAPLDGYNEPFKVLREYFYEAGATFAHATGLNL